MKDVSIDTSALADKSAVEVTGTGAVTVVLEGTNILKSGENKAGLQTNDQTLTVSGTGTLETTGGENAAGIGCGYNCTESTLVFTGGIITAAGNLIDDSGAYGALGKSSISFSDAARPDDSWYQWSYTEKPDESMYLCVYGKAYLFEQNE